MPFTITTLPSPSPLPIVTPWACKQTWCAGHADVAGTFFLDEETSPFDAAFLGVREVVDASARFEREAQVLAVATR